MHEYLQALRDAVMDEEGNPLYSQDEFTSIETMRSTWLTRT